MVGVVAWDAGRRGAGLLLPRSRLFPTTPPLPAHRHPPAHRDRPGTAAEALDLFAAALPQVRLAMGADRDEFSSDAPRLRAI